MNRFSVAQFQKIFIEVSVILRSCDFVFRKARKPAPFGNFVFPLADFNRFVKILLARAYRKRRLFVVKPFSGQRTADKQRQKRVDSNRQRHRVKRIQHAPAERYADNAEHSFGKSGVQYGKHRKRHGNHPHKQHLSSFPPVFVSSALSSSR